MSNSGGFAKAYIAAGLQGNLKKSYELEGAKGTNSNIVSRPVELSPRFQPYELYDFDTANQIKPDLTPIYDNQTNNMVFLRVWFSSKHRYKWEEFESVWKEKLAIRQRLNSIIIGNKERISYFIGIDSFFATTIQKAIKGFFPYFEVEMLLEQDILNYFIDPINNGYELYFREFYPQQPYFKSLSETGSSLFSFYPGCNNLKTPAFAFRQTLAIGLGPEWRINLINLLESQKEASVYGTLSLKSHAAGYGLEDYRLGKDKIDSNKKLAAVIFRIGVVCKKEDSGFIDNFCSSFASNFGGMPFKYLTEKDYEKVLGDKSKLIEMIIKKNYRSGFILSSSEINNLYSPPSIELLECPEYKFDNLTGLIKAPEYISEGNNVILGYNDFAGIRTKIRQQDDKQLRILNNHLAIVGISGAGKSTLIEHIVLEHIGDE